MGDTEGPTGPDRAERAEQPALPPARMVSGYSPFSAPPPFPPPAEPATGGSRPVGPVFGAPPTDDLTTRLPWPPAPIAGGYSGPDYTTARPGPPAPPPGTGWGPPAGRPASRPPTGARPRRGRLAGGVVALALLAGLLGGGLGTAVTYVLVDGTAAPAARSPGTLASPSAGASTAGQPPFVAAPTVPPAPAAKGSVEQVAAQLLPSVVSITAVVPAGVESGSGVILTTGGLILTNNHVVADAATSGGKLTVTFNDGGGAPARIVGRDPITDLAVVRVSTAEKLRPAVLGRSADLRVGQQVVAIGSPLGLSGTVTSGIVSALDRPVRTGSAQPSSDVTSTVIDAIQTDAAINPGNSGGPLVNMNGEVVGINSAIATLGAPTGGESGSIGVGFAIPIDEAKPIADELETTGHAEHALLGVTVADVSTSAGTAAGAGVKQVTPGGAATKAGIRDGDVIVRVDGRLITDGDSLVAAVRSHRPGNTVTITFVRDGTERTVDVTLGSDRGR